MTAPPRSVSTTSIRLFLLQLVRQYAKPGHRLYMMARYAIHACVWDHFTQGLYFHMIRSSKLNNYTTTNKTREVVYFLKMLWRLQTARTSRLRKNHLYLKALIVNALPNVYIRTQNISESSNPCFRNSLYISFQQAGVVRPLRAR